MLSHIGRLVTAFSMVALAAALAGCENGNGDDDLLRAASGPTGPFDPARTKLVVFGMQDPDARMWDEATLVDTLEEYGVSRNGRNLRAWINAIERSDSDLLKGLGGVPGQTVLDIANRTLNAGNNFVERPGVETWGVIEKPENVGGQLGYYWDGNPSGGSGWLWVTMYTRTTLGASDQRKTTAMRYKVEVTGGFFAEPKVSGANNVFPDFASNGGFAVNSVTASGFNWKLWATGDTISVTELYRNNNVEANPDNFVKIVPGSNPQYEHIFTPDSSACIDMMFADASVPQTLPAGAAPPYYCLGRCASPPIINTK